MACMNAGTQGDAPRGHGDAEGPEQEARLDRVRKAIQSGSPILLVMVLALTSFWAWYQWSYLAARDRREAREQAERDRIEAERDKREAVAYASVELKVDAVRTAADAVWIAPRLEISNPSKRRVQPLAVEWWVQLPPSPEQTPARTDGVQISKANGNKPIVYRQWTSVDVRSLSETLRSRPEWKAFLARNLWSEYAFAPLHPGQVTREPTEFFVKTKEHALRVYVVVIFQTKSDGEECILDPSQFENLNETPQQSIPRVCLAAPDGHTCRPKPNTCWAEGTQSLIALP